MQAIEEAKRLKPIDAYHRWVECSDEDQIYIGKCPDLITGIHGDDPVRAYEALNDVVQEVIDHFSANRQAASATSHAADDGSDLTTRGSSVALLLGSKEML